MRLARNRWIPITSTLGVALAALLVFSICRSDSPDSQSETRSARFVATSIAFVPTSSPDPAPTSAVIFTSICDRRLPQAAAIEPGRLVSPIAASRCGDAQAALGGPERPMRFLGAFYVGPRGLPVSAPISGTVSISQSDEGLIGRDGMTIRIMDASGRIAILFLADGRSHVSQGERVIQGQLVATTGRMINDPAFGRADFSLYMTFADSYSSPILDLSDPSLWASDIVNAIR